MWPCRWCHWKWEIPGVVPLVEQRSMKSITENAAKCSTETGKDPTKQRHFLMPRMSVDRWSGLHPGLCRATHHYICSWASRWNCSMNSKAFSPELQNFLSLMHVRKKGLQGGVYKGGDCRKIFMKLCRRASTGGIYESVCYQVLWHLGSFSKCNRVIIPWFCCRWLVINEFDKTYGCLNISTINTQNSHSLNLLMLQKNLNKIHTVPICALSLCWFISKRALGYVDTEII